MTDLVKRLRDHVIGRLPGQEPAVRNGAWDMMLEAADEIERLLAALREIADGADAKFFVKTTALKALSETQG